MNKFILKCMFYNIFMYLLCIIIINIIYKNYILYIYIYQRWGKIHFSESINTHTHTHSHKRTYSHTHTRTHTHTHTCLQT